MPSGEGAGDTILRRPTFDTRNPREAFKIAQALLTFERTFASLDRIMPREDAADEGRRFFKAGKYEEAIPCFVNAACEWSDVDFPHMLGLAYFRQKTPDYDSAIKAFLWALEKPDATIYGGIANEVYKDLTCVLGASGRTEAAAACKKITAFLDQHPDAICVSHDLEAEFELALFPRNTMADKASQPASELGCGLGSAV